MRIKIDEDFYIDKDEYSFTVKESKHKQDKEGNEIYQTYGYYNSLESALNKLKHIKTEKNLKNDVVSLAEYLAELNRQTKLLTDTVEVKS